MPCQHEICPTGELCQLQQPADFQAAFLSELDSCGPPDWQKCLIEMPFLQRQLQLEKDSNHPVKLQRQPSFEWTCHCLLRTERKCFSLRRTRYAGYSFRLKCCLLLIRLCACPTVTPRLPNALSQCLDWGLTPVLHPDVTFLALLLHLSSSVGALPSCRTRAVLASND